MNGKRHSLLAAFGLVVILGALGSVGLRLWLAIDEGRAEAKAAFGELLVGLGPGGEAGGLGDPERRARLLRGYRNDGRLLLVFVTDVRKGLLWRLPDRSPYLPSAENAAAEPRVSAPPLTTILLRADWSGAGRRASVEALYVTLSQREAFLILRDAAAALGAWLLLALLVLLVSGRGDEELRWREAGAAEAPGPRETEAPADTGAAQEEFSGSGAAMSEGRAELSSTKAWSSEGEESGAQEDLEGDIGIPELEAGAEERAPEGLYSPDSGLGYESWLEERLGGELSRSAAIEQDLSLLLLSLEGLSRADADYRVIAEAARDFFSFRDLAFERGEGGFALVLPNLDLAHALRMAEEFHKKLAAQLHHRARSAAGEGLPLYLGLSSRAGRLVEARRLIEEASLALDRAREEKDTKIVAFKPDPDKYRLWLASLGS